jgi:DNA-binding response OmpR family regulator
MAAIPIVEDNRNLASFEARILREAGHTPILAAALADQPAQAADEEAQAHRH